jgi:hypothetical protein
MIGGVGGWIVSPVAGVGRMGPSGKAEVIDDARGRDAVMQLRVRSMSAALPLDSGTHALLEPMEELGAG